MTQDTLEAIAANIEGLVGFKTYPPKNHWKHGRIRIEFETNEHAKSHRTTVGCGGWVLGRFIYPGTGWIPSEVMLDCPDEGLLE
jgi:hypothetical protein